MSTYKKLKQLTDDLVAKLSAIDDTSHILPHTVFVEEVGDDATGAGVPVYNKYQLTKIYPDGSCDLQSPISGITEQRHLSEINIDWLDTVWRWYLDQQGIVIPESEVEEVERTSTNPLEEPLRRLLDVALLEITCFDESLTFDICKQALEKLANEPEKELSVFTFPIDDFERNASDDEILAAWNDTENDSVQKYTPHEFAAEINDDTFDNMHNYVRFIETEV